MNINAKQREEHRTAIPPESRLLEAQLFLDDLYDHKRLVRTMQALAQLVLVGVLLCLGTLVLAVLFFFWALAMR